MVYSLFIHSAFSGYNYRSDYDLSFIFGTKATSVNVSTTLVGFIFLKSRRLRLLVLNIFVSFSTCFLRPIISYCVGFRPNSSCNIPWQVTDLTVLVETHIPRNMDEQS